ncbi:aminoglycoside phosphotransferase family protein [Kitasatospora purpeofusca]|uniref:aminoglycoside phosphotransferase family protein n=1 Tax=Kitasatospora purpeofusca TaxID=67352 RepID=UPI0036C8ACA8
MQAIADFMRRGKVNHRWVASLPEQVAALAREWELDIGEVAGVDYSSAVTSVLVSCTGPMGEAELKLAPDAYALAEEVAMLRQFAPGGRVPQVYGSSRGAALLEAVRPGTPVEDLPRPPSADDYARFLDDLHTAGDPASAPRQTADWLALMLGWAEQGGAELAEARRTADRLLATEPERVLLHGDLHLGNVLTSDRRGLVARSPIACIGERCFDAADYVLEGADLADMVGRRDALAAATGLDAERLDGWARVLAPLGAARAPQPERVATLLAYGRGEY